MSQTSQVGYGQWDSTGDDIVGDAKTVEMAEFADIRGDITGETVSGEVDDTKERK